MLAGQQQHMQQNPPLNPNLFHQQMAAALQMVHQQNQHHQAFSANPNLAANSALMGIMGMRNGLIDYSRMMKIPTSREFSCFGCEFLLKILKRTVVFLFVRKRLLKNIVKF